MTATWSLCLGDVREQLRAMPSNSVHTAINSAPYYGLRDYNVEGQIGLEDSWREHVSTLVEVYAEMRRVLRGDGTHWLNYGDAYAQGGTRATPEELAADQERAELKGYPTQAFAGYAGWDRAAGTVGDGLKAKDLMGLPWRLAFALQEDGWYLRSGAPWIKRNAMPESARDRPSSALEYMFLMSPGPRYFYDLENVRVKLITKEKRAERIVYNGKSKKTSTFIPPNPNGRNRRNSDFWIDSLQGFTLGPDDEILGWDVNPANFTEGHFATFPEPLVMPCILAGTSERGCCPACGAQWIRLLEPTEEYAALLAEKSWSAGDLTETRASGKGSPRSSQPGIRSSYRTVGWDPSCKCEAGEPIPCTVLDCFAGSGTTGVVAAKLGRNFVGVELNPEYHAMASERLAAAYAGLSLREHRAGQGALFGEVAL